MRLAYAMACMSILCFGATGSTATTSAKPVANRARPAEPLDPKKTLRALESADPKERADAVAKLGESLAMTFGRGPAGVKTDTFADPLLQVILKAVTDTDSEVRGQGFGVLNVIAHVNIWARLKNGQIDPNANVAIDLTREPGIRTEIIRRLDDHDWQVRKDAIYALGDGYMPSADTEKILLERWKVESARPFKRPAERINIDEVRQAISEGLRSGQYRSKDTVGTLMKMLDDRVSGIQAVAAVHLSEIKVGEAIPKIVSNARAGDPYARQGAAQALGNYGEAAKDHLPELEEIESKADEPVKQHLKAAIKQIKESKKSQ